MLICVQSHGRFFCLPLIMLRLPMPEQAYALVELSWLLV